MNIEFKPFVASASGLGGRWKILGLGRGVEDGGVVCVFLSVYLPACLLACLLGGVMYVFERWIVYIFCLMHLLILNSFTVYLQSGFNF